MSEIRLGSTMLNPSFPLAVVKPYADPKSLRPIVYAAFGMSTDDEDVHDVSLHEKYLVYLVYLVGSL